MLGAPKIIRHRFPGVPNHGDITAIDFDQVTPIDVLTAGWPCQPFSRAGKQKGATDDRALWPHVARAVRVLRPRWFVGENVAAIADRRTGPELARAVADLAALGYVGSWRCVRASDVGAPHRRERIFLVAADTRSEAGRVGPGLRPHGPVGIGRGRSDHGAVPGSLLPTPDATHGRKLTRTGPLLAGAVELLSTPLSSLADGVQTLERQVGGRGALLPTPTATPYGNNQSPSPGAAVRPSLDGLVQLLPTPTAMDRNASGGGRPSDVTLTDATVRRADRFGQYGAAVDRWAAILGRPAPDPTIPGRNNGRRLNPRFVEWMMGCADGWVTDVPDLTISQQLKALGNGVVTLQAVHALHLMLGGR